MRAARLGSGTGCAAQAAGVAWPHGLSLSGWRLSLTALQIGVSLRAPLRMAGKPLIGTGMDYWQTRQNTYSLYCRCFVGAAVS